VDESVLPPRYFLCFGYSPLKAIIGSTLVARRTKQASKATSSSTRGAWYVKA